MQCSDMLKLGNQPICYRLLRRLSTTLVHLRTAQLSIVLCLVDREFYIDVYTFRVLTSQRKHILREGITVHEYHEYRHLWFNCRKKNENK